MAARLTHSAVASLRAAAGRLVDTVRTSGALWTTSLVLDRVFPVGILGLWPERRVTVAMLGEQIGSILRAWGMSPEHTATTVEYMLYADLRGIDSHGCSMLPHYQYELDAGILTMTPTIAVVREDETTALIDGGGGLGHVPADMAMKLAVTKCRERGVAAVAVRNSGHYGAAGAYAAIAAGEGMIGLATTNIRVPAVVPTFGADAKLGTNPIAFAAPATRNPPFLLDMATSTASLSGLAMAWRKGRAIPVGWAIDAHGGAVRHGLRAARQRRLMPLGSSREMGSHKGYGLAAMVEILSAALPGRASPTQSANTAGEIGHFFLAIDPRRFRAAGEFEADLDGLLDTLRACRPLDEREPVLVAGDPERAAFAKRNRDGIPLARGVVEDIRAVATRAGVTFRLGE